MLERGGARDRQHDRRAREQPGERHLRGAGSVEIEPIMDVERVAQAVVYMASLPLSENVQFMTIMATKMPFVGRG